MALIEGLAVEGTECAVIVLSLVSSVVSMSGAMSRAMSGVWAVRFPLGSLRTVRLVLGTLGAVRHVLGTLRAVRFSLGAERLAGRLGSVMAAVVVEAVGAGSVVIE
jgi:hypothetical protein